MNAQERMRIVNILSYELTEKGPIPLPTVPRFLPSGACPSNIGLKKWLESEFPEFFVFGTYGRETVDFANSALSRFYKLLIATLPIGKSPVQIPLYKVRELIAKVGLDPAQYNTVGSVKQLLWVYPSYELVEQPDPRYAAIPSAATTAFAQELSFVHSVTYMNWRTVYNKIHCHEVNSALSLSSIRDSVVHRFSKALVDGEDLLLDAINDNPRRVAFFSGYQTDDGRNIYCVLQPNMNEGKKQAWMLAGVVYPDEPDEAGLGVWLARKYFPQSGITYQAIQTQIDELTTLRATLLLQVRDLLQSLETSSRPVSISADIAEYERQWEELSDNLAQFPLVPEGTELRLPQLRALLEEKNGILDMARHATSLFDQVYKNTAQSLGILDAVCPSSDLETVHSLFAGSQMTEDIDAFRQILKPYVCLKRVLCAENRSNVLEEIATVAGHFSLSKPDVAGLLVNEYSKRYAYLDDLDEIDRILDSCLQAASLQVEQMSETVDADTIAAEILNLTTPSYSNWLSSYCSLAPEDRQFRSAILTQPDGAGFTDSFTPGSVAARILNSCGNRERLAERYLLLGLLTDRAACVGQLLELYRKEDDQERFLAIWDSEYRESNYTAEDACYRLAIRCANESITREEIEEFIALNPGIKKVKAFRDTILAEVFRSGEESVAYQRWMGMNNLQLNSLEMAVADNDADAVYQQLADSGRLLELGYSETELLVIHQAVTSGLPEGTDLCAKARRLYQVQKNKNCSAECLLWSAPLTQASQQMLFAMYSDMGDHSSVCWMTQKFSIALDTPAIAVRYAVSLSETKQYSILSELMMEHPELWHKSALLAQLEDEPWPEIYQREISDPLGSISPFSAALISDDTAAMEQLLDNAETMAASGYSADMVQTLHEKLTAGSAPSGTDRVSVLKRFRYYQGNLNRDMEQYLYQQCHINLNWAAQQLFTLTYTEGRYFEALRYFECYPMLQRMDSNVCLYLWCLLRLERNQALVEQALRHSASLRIDRELVKAIVEHARENNLTEFSDDIQRIITRLPTNAFEEAVMQSKNAQMLEYISDPDLLTSMGYTADHIKHFKECITKPFPYGSEGYPLGVRMRMFFGNERALPFLEDASDDPRSAKLLLDMYFSAGQWDLVCNLYRAHLNEGIWNPTFEMRYLKALSKACLPENCRAYLDYLLSEGCEEQNESAYPWKYLRGLIGTGQENAALAEMERLTQDDCECTAELVPDTLELAWETGSDTLRDQLVLFAARICLKNMAQLSPEQQKKIISINGRLLLSDDSRHWLGLLEENSLSKISALLMCYFKYGIEDEQSLYAAGENLLRLLDDPKESRTDGILPAVTTFVLDNGLLESTASEQYDILLPTWLRIVLNRGEEDHLLGLETLDAAQFHIFLSLWQAATPTDQQLREVLVACFPGSDTCTEWTPLFFQRFVPMLEKLSGHSSYEKEYAVALMDAFSHWFAGVDESQKEHVQLASIFLRSATYNADQLSGFLDRSREQVCLYDTLIRDAVMFRCENSWPDVLYRYLQNQYFCPGLEERQSEAQNRAKLLLYANQIEVGTDNQSLQFAYNILSKNPSQFSLNLLYRIYQKAGKDDLADVLRYLEAIFCDSIDTDSLCAWFHELLNTHSVEWIEYYSQWWTPMVQLRDTDKQTRSILSYLVADETSMQYKGSVLRLLLSDLFNGAYIGCYLRLAPEMKPEAWGKLAYIRAVHNPTVCEPVIRECIRKKQYLYAVKLLTTRVKPAPARAVFIGQTLAEIYTAEALRLFPELTEQIPSAFELIINLNREDPRGAWKNVGRAVDIAILTERENLFLDIFNREAYVSYAGMSAALIANMILRGEFRMADHYLKEYYAGAHNDPFSYMALIHSLIDECLSTGELSWENEILLRSIPVNGNMRPLEMYGTLVNRAIRDDRLVHCARAFYRLRSFTSKDKALLASCVHLYAAVSDELEVEKFYDVAVEYLSVVQDALVGRVTQVLTVIAACSSNTVNYGRLAIDCRNRFLNENHDMMRRLFDLWQKCTRFLDDAPGDANRRTFLLRAATGWWRIDKNTVPYFTTYPDLCTGLADIYPSSFYSACAAAVLRNPSDLLLRNTILTLFDYRKYAWGKDQLSAATKYPVELAVSIADMLDLPMDLPGLYTQCLAQTMAEPDEERFLKQMTMLLMIQQNYLIRQYEDNVCNLKELSESCSGSRRIQISGLIRRKSLSIGRIEKPEVYLRDGDYEMVALAAEKQLDGLANSPQNQNQQQRQRREFFRTLQKAYLDLGRFMTEQSTSKTYYLSQLMNMTTVLCQSDCYRDLDKLLAVCPAKWQLCLRATQELIQGNPQNVLLLLANSDFRRHDGCHKFVHRMVNGCRMSKVWREAVQQEGLILPDPGPPTSYDSNLIRPIRNPALLDSFTEFLDVHIRQMNEDDRADEKNANDSSSDTIDAGGELACCNESIWEVGFVTECLEQYQEDKPADNDTEDSDFTGAARERKDALYRALKEQPGDADFIRNCSALLSLMRQEPITQETVELCVKLGMALYRENISRNGMVEHVTERSRNILYSMAAFADVLCAMPGMASTISVYVRQCLVSYNSLSDLTSDCASDDLLKLCEIIAREDKDAAAYLSKHILFAREIGQKMREPMTNNERERWLHKCVSTCRNIENPVEKDAKETLANMLDQEIRAFRNKAQLDVRVYNTECAAGYGCIFGEVCNIGGENVDNLVLSLYIDELFAEQYSLATLISRDSVPFALPCKDSDLQTISYKLMLKYTTQDGVEEQNQPVEGTLTFREMEPNRLRKYDASNPADSDNYVERATVTATLESNYLVEGGFRRFPNLFIYGMKRSGKSSILRRLGRLFDANYPDDIRHVIVSCEGLEGDFYTRVHYVFVNYVLDELNYKFDLESQDGWQEFCEKWAEPPEAISDFRWIDRFYTALTRQWMPDKGLVILIDEIERLYYEFEAHTGDRDVMDDAPPETVDSSIAQSQLWDVLNKMTQRDGSSIRFVLCGSDFFTSKLIAEGDNLTQFFQKGVKLNVDRMEASEIREALRANSSINIPDETLDYLWNIASGMPWHSKVFCNSVIDNELKQEERTRTTIYPSDIQDAIDRVLSSTKDVASPANFGLLSLSAEEDLIVRVVANSLESRLTTISFDDLMERVCQESGNCEKQEVYAKALRSLVNERKLLRVDNGRHYQFSRELYRMYLRRELPLRFIK